MQLLTEQACKTAMDGLPNWQYVAGKLSLSLTFNDFNEAWAFMSEVALVATKMDHHPNWHNVYNRVNIELITHDLGGITEKDIALAQAVNDLLQRRATEAS